MAVREIRDEVLPAVRVLTKEQRVRVSRLPVVLDALFTLLEAEAEVMGLRSEGGGFVRYLGKVNEVEDGPVQACLPVSGDGGHVMPELRAIAIDGAGEDARYPGVLALYDQLSAHMETTGLTAEGPPRETYAAGRITVAWAVRPA